MKPFVVGDSVSNEMLSAIEQHGYYIQRDVIEPTDAAALRALMEIRYHMDHFKKAGVGRGASHGIHEEIRKDSILWIEPEPNDQLLSSYLAFVHSIIPVVNRGFFLALRELEMMFAVYEEGSYYRRHKDRFDNQSHRYFTIVLYLSDWKEGDGGELMLYVNNQEIAVKPQAGTFIIFTSETEHEVLSTNARRHSITGWLRD